MKARPSCSLTLSSGCPGPGRTQPLQTAGSSEGCSMRGFSVPPEKSAAASVFSHSGVCCQCVCCCNIRPEHCLHVKGLSSMGHRNKIGQ